MSFWKQFLPDFDKPTGRHQGRDSNAPPRPTSHRGTDDERGPPVTLSLIRSALYDADDDDDPYELVGQIHTANDPTPPSFDIVLEASSVDEVLQTTRKYLDAEILAERGRVDWTPECKFEKIVMHPKGNELPEFSTAEELREVIVGAELTIPIKKMGMNIERGVMDRIRAGLGPRPSKIEDLVESLRLEPRQDAEPSHIETYDELLAVLQAWNMRVGKVPELHRERVELLEALEERCQLITEVESKRQEDEALVHQSMRVSRALHAFRPELQGFENQDIRHQLTLLIANHCIAFPHLDDETKDGIIKTLYREHRSRIYLHEANSTRRHRLDAEIERAKLQEDKIEAGELMKRRMKLDEESWDQAAEEIRTAIKSARKHVYKAALEELQSLAEQHAGQRWAACGLAKAPASVLVQKCMEKDSDVDNMLKDWDSEIDRALSSAIWYVRNMNRLGVDNLLQVRKFAGLDRPKAERKAVVQRRLNDPRTPRIMMEVQSQGLQVHDMSQRVQERMDDLDYSLGCILDAVSSSFQAYNTLLAHVDDGDAHCTAPPAYVVKGFQNGGRLSG